MIIRGSIKLSSADSLQYPVSGRLMLADKSRPRIIFAAPNRAELADRADLRFRGPLKNQRRGRGTSEDPSGCREVMRHYIARGLRSGESTESGQGDCGRGRNMFLRRWCNITELLSSMQAHVSINAVVSSLPGATNGLGLYQQSRSHLSIPFSTSSLIIASCSIANVVYYFTRFDNPPTK
jgi:hypothetical protein